MYLSGRSEVRVETSGNEVSYVFPPRPLGSWRWLGLIPVGFSLIFILGPFRMIARALSALTDDATHPALRIVPFAILAFMVAGACIPACIGLLMIFGRCRVEWRDGRITVVDYFGPIRWRRRLPKQPIRKLIVKRGGAKVNDQPVTSGPLAELGALIAEFEQVKPRTVAVGYPRDWLEDLAHDLSTRSGASASTLTAPPVELVDMGIGVLPAESVDVAEQPAGSPVRLERQIRGISLIIPPAGLRKGSKGLFVFGILWCLFMVVFTIGFLFADGKPRDTPGGVFFFIGVFWLIGLGMLAAAINMGRRQAALSVEQGKLTITQTGPFGTKLREWQRGDIAALRVDKSGVEVNDVPILELQVHPVTGKKVGLFSGRDDLELRWMVTELRKALDVPAERK